MTDWTPDHYLDGVTRALAGIDRGQITEVIGAFERAYGDNRRVFLCGNGGSASTASHLVCDLQKSLIAPDGRALKAIALTDSIPLITAWANDADYSMVFANQLAVLATAGDLLLAISGSGNSPNVLAAVRKAREMGVISIGWSAFDGGQLAGLVDLSIIVPANNMQIAEDAHLVLGHLVFTHMMRWTSKES